MSHSITEIPSRPITITQATVKVMRSHDYCHFEISLSTSDTIEGPPLSLPEVDELRKAAARLADKAVEQYKIAKEWASKNLTTTIGEKYQRVKKLAEIAQETPEQQRTPEEKAIIKEVADLRYEMMRRYDYEDDWDDRNLR